MIKNHLKIAWRNLLKNKGYTIINIIGLATGIAAVLLIAIWIQNQFLYDSFYTNKENIYKLWSRTDYQGNTNVGSITMAPAAEALKREYPEVEHSARLYWATESLISFGDINIKSEGNEVDSDFLKIFNFPVRQGISDGMLSTPNNIVLTKSLSKSLFGEQNPLNKTVTFGSGESYKVTGVLEDLPSYSSFNFKYLIPLTESKTKEYGTNWNTNTYYTFVTLKAGTDVEQFNNKIKPLIRTNAKDLKWTSVFLYPITKQYLYGSFKNGIPSGGRIDQVRLIGAIGLLILGIACINFMNLSTARSQKRSKEVGVRKVVGAKKWSLIQQFLIESMLLALIAGIIAIMMTILFLPVFNRILGAPLLVDWSSPIIWGLGLGFVLLTGLLAGIYPAFVLSAFKPIKSLRDTSNRSHVFSFREALVVIQFGIAIFLIVATLVIRLQISYAGEREIGYNPAQLIEIPVEGNLERNYEAVKTTLLDDRTATNITRTGWTITADNASSGGNFTWEGSTPEQEKNTTFTIVRTSGDDFIKTLGLTLIDGRDINYANFPADSTGILLNETAIKTMGLQNPVGKYLKWGDAAFTIVGIIKDYVSGSPYQEVRPLLIHPSTKYLQNIVVRTNGQLPMNQTLANLEMVVKKINPNYPFTYRFVDEQYAQKFKQQEQIGRLAFVFSVLAIFISCLGLFGLASYIAETRTKEIGIRKVLGASVLKIVKLLSFDFLKLVVFALLISVPFGWLAMYKWMDNFAYHIELDWWVFVFAGCVALTIAFLTISYQTIRAAIINPVECLRDE